MNTGRALDGPSNRTSKLVLPHRLTDTAMARSSCTRAAPSQVMVAFFTITSHSPPSSSAPSDRNHRSAASSQYAR